MSNNTTPLGLLALILVFFPVKAFSIVFINFLIFRFAFNLQQSLRVRLFSDLCNASYLVVAQRTPAEYIRDVFQLTNDVVVEFTIPILRAFSELLVFIALLILLFCVSDWLVITLFGIWLGGVLFSYLRLVRKRLVRYGELLNHANGEIIETVNDGIMGFKQIKVLNAEHFFLSRLGKYANSAAIASSLNLTYSSSSRFVLEACVVIGIVVGVAAYTTFSVEQTNLLPAVFTAIVAGLRLLPSANLIVKSISQSWYSRDAASRLSKEFIKLAQESDTVNANEASSKIFNSLELRQFRPDAAFLNQPLKSAEDLILDNL